MLSIIYGNEPYVINRLVKETAGKLEMPEMDYVQVSSAEDFFQNVDSRSFTGGMRILHWVMQDLSTVTEEMLLAAIQSENQVFLCVTEVDKRRTLYRKFENYYQCCDKEHVYPSLCESIRGFFMPDAFTEYCSRTDYLNNASVSYYTVIREVEQLTALGNPITKETVEKNVTKYVEEDTFGISPCIVKGDMAGVLSKAGAAANEIGLLSALQYEIRVAYKSKFFSRSSIGARENSFFALSAGQLAEMHHAVTKSISDLKSTGISKDIITRSCLEFLVVMAHGRE